MPDAPVLDEAAPGPLPHSTLAAATDEIRQHTLVATAGMITAGGNPSCSCRKWTGWNFAAHLAEVTLRAAGVPGLLVELEQARADVARAQCAKTCQQGCTGSCDRRQ